MSELAAPAPRWLSPDERRAWLALYAVATRLTPTLDADLFRRARITLFDYHVLAMASEAPGRALPMSELAARSNASLSRLSHVVKKLENRGWMERSPSPDDARVTTAALTDEGLAALEGLAPDHVRSVRDLVFDGLDARDVEDLERVGRKILARIEPGNSILENDQT
ncbi:MarR family transcriptional regulator [Arthrobacter sp. zg-Y820]|uniref:MarR family winged helix-turn-helix transcriptional regulator n=1 Tax=unclassified Arthrobacter TaxID=235627 RepID=UPI001E3AA000|nr:MULTISPECIES: MarR family transcriptional regulator [unclassified Arthrobacter]MCC9197050.1 MarR family transcriptional regulator [Arthrobacter sp. zg-Y820]MDK1279915.1 MarR family transcriptional regulator [Arthrobacter sp. zg.Y820]MDK1361602.1 MarR family transcriptional regulator [Arthrobacter sp. zg-Y1219]WIB09216.1 MarR family transcriptional regulator [Arthrobacter sp. zg-Y820]